MHGNCKEIENLQIKHKGRALHMKVKEILGVGKPKHNIYIYIYRNNYKASKLLLIKAQILLFILRTS